MRTITTLVNSMFESADGQVRLMIDRKCKELIKDFEQVSYQANTTIVDKTSDPARTHLSDALGYLLWQECGRQKIGERGTRLL